MSAYVAWNENKSVFMYYTIRVYLFKMTDVTKII